MNGRGGQDVKIFKWWLCFGFSHRVVIKYSKVSPKRPKIRQLHDVKPHDSHRNIIYSFMGLEHLPDNDQKIPKHVVEVQRICNILASHLVSKDLKILTDQIAITTKLRPLR